MRTIIIKQEESTTHDIVLYLEHITHLMAQGYTSGDGWILEGEEEEVEEETEEEADFTGATSDDGEGR